MEDTGLDGKEIYTPREWTDRFRHYIKRIHNIDIKPVFTEGKITDPNSNGKEEEMRKDFVWGDGPGALEEITKGEYNTDPDNIKADALMTMFKECYTPKGVSTIEEAISSGQNARTQKHPKTIGTESKFITSITEKNGEKS